MDAAVAWKRDMERARADGRTVAAAPTLRVAADRWYADALAGVALARGRKPFKTGVLAEYKRLLDGSLLPAYGDVRLDALEHRLSGIVADLQRRGLAASTVRNTVMPLRAIFRHAVQMKWVQVNPTLGMVVPAGSGRRLRIIAPQDIPAYLGALADRDRPLWATAVYAGLRRGELQALRWRDLDLAAGVIVVDEEVGGYDQKSKATQSPKSEAGGRRVPVNGILREVLLEHRARAGARPQGLVFSRGSLSADKRGGNARDPALPFNDSSTGGRAKRAWTRAGLPAVTLHECRHTFASLMIAAMAQRGVFNPKLLQAVLGHSSVQVSYDTYGHLFPGQEGELGVMLDEFLAASAALPDVAQDQQQRWSWQEAPPDDGLLPSSPSVVSESREHPASVQHATDLRGPR